ncbi:DUF2577 domain-containing protein [Lysinibacillus telephonicus]|uniref:DUF2577 domain-containing protein n=1 Tax=Lysinibacillus telephonicus TaxID=1714840 RepID=A0A431UPF0_9BACI|nr:DUF2577 domain-containing protein [Lysinibacillus telephonicus]RTQ91638.1 DUF2577 domain-containing protein [Lysinibacillus telephonicus]
MNDFLNIIKKVAINSMNAQKLTTVVYGIVIDVNPLKVQIDQKLVLEKEHLKLTRNVKDFTVEATMNGSKQNYTVHNSLKKGDKVTMIRVHGGQQYIIVDKE